MLSSIPYGAYTNDNRAKTLDAPKKDAYSDNLSMNSSYACDNGILVLPLSDPRSESVVFCRMHNKVGTRTVEWSALKRGTPPVVPAPMDSYVAGDVIIGHEISIAKPVADSSSGGMIWSLSGTYTYGQSQVRDENYHFETGISSIGESFMFSRVGFNNTSGRTGLTSSNNLSNNNYNGEVPSTLFGTGGTTTDVAVPVVDFGETDYSYYSPIFSNQFFVQSLIL